MSSPPYPVDPQSPKIQEVSAWAVNEYNKRGHCLKFQKALKAEEIAINGMVYNIELEASNGGLLGKYYASVYEFMDTITLQVFKPLVQPQPLLEVDARIAIPN